MRDVNKVILIGRLGSNPIQRRTKVGFPVTQFSVATSRRVPREENQSDANLQSTPGFAEETQWHRVVAWGKQAEACATYLKKGSSVYVEGSIRSRFYENREGKQTPCFEIQAENVSFLQNRRNMEREISEDTVSTGEVASPLPGAETGAVGPEAGPSETHPLQFEHQDDRHSYHNSRHDSHLDSALRVAEIPLGVQELNTL